MVDFAITLLLFSSMEVVSKPLMGLLSPEALTLYRFLAGFTVILFTAWRRERFPENRESLRRAMPMMALCGFLNVFFSMTMLQKAVSKGSASTAALIFCSNPLFVFMLDVFVKKERATIKGAVGIVLACSGLVLVFIHSLSFSSGTSYALAASLSFALYTVINKGVTRSVHPVTVNLVSFFWGLLFLSAYVWLARIPLRVSSELWRDPVLTLDFLYLGLLVSGVAYITFMRTIKRFSATSASVIFLLKPLLASLFSLLLLHETLNTFFLGGMVLVISGSSCVMKR